MRLRLPRLRRRNLTPTERAEEMRAESDKLFAELELTRSRIRAKALPMRQEADRILAPVGDPANMHYIGTERENESLLDPISEVMAEKNEAPE